MTFPLSPRGKGAGVRDVRALNPRKSLGFTLSLTLPFREGEGIKLRRRLLIAEVAHWKWHWLAGATHSLVGVRSRVTLDAEARLEVVQMVLERPRPMLFGRFDEACDGALEQNVLIPVHDSAALDLVPHHEGWESPPRNATTKANINVPKPPPMAILPTGIRRRSSTLSLCLRPCQYPSVTATGLVHNSCLFNLYTN